MTKPFINIQSDGGRIGRVCWRNGRPTLLDRNPFRWGGVAWDGFWPGTDPTIDLFRQVLDAMKEVFAEGLREAFDKLNSAAPEVTATVHSATDGDAT